MDIIVTDRETIEKGLVVKAGTYVLISVRDPKSRKVRYRKASGLVDLLELTFHDSDPTAGLGHPEKIRHMTKGDADKIAKFVLQQHDQIDAIVVHCEQGMSRSPAIASAIAEYFQQDVSIYDRDYQLNRYVRDLVRNALDDAQHDDDALDEPRPSETRP
jgi:predicted protein tyrosine phosphatase